MTAARRIAAWALGASLTCGAPIARGDTPRAPAPAQAPATADALVREGRRLLAEGKLDEGCARLSAAQKMEPSAGTATALGDCLRKAGRVAGARAAYDEARALARRAADEADARLREIEEGQPRVMLLAPGGVAPGTSIRLDGVPIDPAAIGAAFPVQPGDHLLEVRRAGSRWTARVEVEAGAIARVALPGQDGVGGTAEAPAAPEGPGPGAPEPPGEPKAPDDAHPAPSNVGHPGGRPGAPSDTPPAPARPTPKGPALRWEAHRISGVTIGSAGVVALVTGAVFGAQAIARKNASNDGHCNGADLCDATGRSLRAEAMTAGNAATVALFAGGAAVASGLALFFTAPAGAPVTGQVGLAVSPGALRLVGRW